MTVIDLGEARRTRANKADFPQLSDEAVDFVRCPRRLSEHEKELLVSVVRFCLAFPERLTVWEHEFLCSIARWPRWPTEKQRQALERILDKIDLLEERAL
jgi:hypothetical protein